MDNPETLETWRTQDIGHGWWESDVDSWEFSRSVRVHAIKVPLITEWHWNIWLLYPLHYYSHSKLKETGTVVVVSVW